MPINIFCCYAHEDKPILMKLITHLSPLQRQGLIDIWYDGDISAGTKWEPEVKEHLNFAQIILLLISPDFMASDYSYNVGMQQALARYNSGEAKVIPIVLRHVYWHDHPLSRLQHLPPGTKPIISSSWFNLDEALYHVVKGLQKAVVELITKSTGVSPVVPVQRPVNALCDSCTPLTAKDLFQEGQESLKSKKIAETFLKLPYKSFHF
jgi:hypothetical protein